MNSYEPQAATPITTTWGWIKYWAYYHIWLSFKRILWRLFVCSHRPHKLGSDSGYMLGRRTVDRWCERCGKRIEIPFEEQF